MDSPPRLQRGDLATVIEPMTETEPTNVRVPLQRRSVSALVALCVSGIVPSSCVAESPMSPDGTPPSLSYLGELDPYSPARIPAEPAKGLNLAGSMGDIFDTIGNQVIVDAGQIRAGLSPDEAVVITEADSMLGRVNPPQTLVIFPHNELEIDNQSAVTEAATKLTAANNNPNDNSAMGSITDFATAELDEGWVPLGNGILPHTIQATLSVERYVLSDGDYSQVSVETTTATPINNVSCDNLPDAVRSITAETELTPEQKTVVCETLDNYAYLIPETAMFQLDSINGPFQDRSEAKPIQDSAVINYPYIGDVEVDPDDFRQTVLHEITHLIYFRTDPASAEMKKLTTAYDQIVHVSQVTEQGSSEDRIWQTLTESNYWGGNSIAGHPQSNPSELLSSTASVIAYFPNEFLYEYNQLNPVAQKAVRNAVIATSNFYEANGIYPAKVMPDIDNILEIIVPAEEKDPSGPTKHFPLNDNPATPLYSNERRHIPWRGKELAEV